MANAETSVKIRQLTHTKSRFCFLVGVIMEIEQLLVQADPVNEKYSPLCIRTLNDTALQRNGRCLRCPHAKSCALPKGSVRMHDPYTEEALLIQETSTANEIFDSTVFTR